ncbi:MAG: amidohydrolase [Chloroflexi bacterium]|nr:amidohydrolase [Chloroflexota bacterium]MYC54702.1 amidohydrolase [Chloroflexota bacterium]MYE78377.1 amidohydrolase [Chloroflexota bacterium]
MSVVIDCQSHIFPRGYAELLLKNRGSVQTTGGDGVYLIDYGVQRFRLSLDDYSPARKLADMDRCGVDMSLLSVNIPSPDLLDAELAVAGARICNEAVAGLCARHPQRFAGIASLPLDNVPAAIDELRRATHELGLRGVFTPSHINGAPLDDPRFEPLYAECAALGVPLVLHPNVPTWGQAIQAHSMIPMFGFMVDTSIAMLRLILGGVMERHPQLTVVHPHAGGVLPYVMGRVIEQTEVKRRGREHITQSPRETYRRVYLDTVAPDALALQFAFAFAGADRLLFGSDHPWVSIDVMLEHARSIECSATDKRKILAENAQKLFGIA